MLPADIPDDSHLIELIDHRAVPAVTIALASSPLPQDHERVRISLRDAIAEVERRFAHQDLPHGAGDDVLDALGSLLTDDDFWSHQSRSIVALASPGRLEAFRLAHHASDVISVADRFDVAPLLRASAHSERAFVLQISEGFVRLTEVGPGHGPVEHALDLPGDHELMLAHAANDGQLDRRRAQGAKGENVERERYCRVVNEEVARIVPEQVTLLLAASADLESAYRAVNTHENLYPEGVEAHPESLDDAEIDQLARDALDELRAAETAEWKERFGTLRAQGLATSRLDDVAAAAVQAAIDELRFDMDANQTGTVDEFGRVRPEADRPDDQLDAPRLVDEIVSRVLHSGGRVRAVHNRDLVDGSPVAATLRFPVSSTSR
ncbi:hypothetical protein K0817_014190 [Microbacterium sp. HD4P20]|uniref:baeRF11 domain-containing protein n=1 Tax=Microbacterium sp. HD4P20 TaxID=2864874 RepID=UPI001C64409D|nr:hypothetical protein [Microbacterium sp. HD4P20]MCP2637703.1 hypothetical protein [Microbacterium sp. HD4P20]